MWTFRLSQMTWPVLATGLYFLWAELFVWANNISCLKGKLLVSFISRVRAVRLWRWRESWNFDVCRLLNRLWSCPIVIVSRLFASKFLLHFVTLFDWSWDLLPGRCVSQDAVLWASSWLLGTQHFIVLKIAWHFFSVHPSPNFETLGLGPNKGRHCAAFLWGCGVSKGGSPPLHP